MDPTRGHRHRRCASNVEAVPCVNRVRGLRGRVARRGSDPWWRVDSDASAHEAGWAAGLRGAVARFAAARFVAARGRFVAVVAGRLAAGRFFARPSPMISDFGIADFAGIPRRAAVFRFAAGRARVAFAGPDVAGFLAVVAVFRAAVRLRAGVASEGLRDARVAGAFVVVFFAPPVRAVLLDIIDVVSRFAATRRR